MKAVIFSGGPGTRFWPVSRTHQSKTVAKTFGGKSFLEVTVERLVGLLGGDNVYIATGQDHESFLKTQVPQIKSSCFILEPAYKDTAMAVFNAARFLNETAPNDPFGIFWSDHLVKDMDTFEKGFEIACKKVLDTGKLVYFETPMRFPDVNLGHVKTGKKIESMGEKIALYEFDRFLEKPDIEKAKQYFENKDRYFWNTGYLVSTPKILLAKYQKYAPEFYSLLDLPVNEAFEKAEKVSFDYAVAEKLTSDDCLVLVADMG
ncbi:MAG: sugar phosphate nucleotidyltransferase, partial [bacterium]